MRVLAFLTSILIASTVMATEEPKYVLLEKSEPFELRAYAPLIVAEVKVDGDLDAASNQGFRLIAAYIFGKNQVSEKIAMTAPVGIESSDQNKSAKIAMTAPVGIESSRSTEGAGNQWTVSFVMPAEKRAVITFSGFYNEEKVQEKTQALRDWIKIKNLKPVGEPQFARYNPPWTLPFMRRNEVMIQVVD